MRLKYSGVNSRVLIKANNSNETVVKRGGMTPELTEKYAKALMKSSPNCWKILTEAEIKKIEEAEKIAENKEKEVTKNG